MDEGFRNDERGQLPVAVHERLCVCFRSFVCSGALSMWSDANYLLKVLQGFKSKGVTIYAIGIQARSIYGSSRFLCLTRGVLLTERAGEL